MSVRVLVSIVKPVADKDAIAVVGTVYEPLIDHVFDLIFVQSWMLAA